MQLQLEAVSKRFGSVVALDAVDLDVPSGRKVALVGPNGSGKSTLTRVLMGLVSFAGRARLDGLCPTRDRAALAPRMAYVPQIAPRFGVTVRELVRLVTDVRGASAQRVGELTRRLDLDLEVVAGRRFCDLSGGMRQKLLIALALTPRCELLIMDEPTASLDTRARRRFFELFLEEAREATLVLCSHRLAEIRHLVDHVVVLADGRVARTQGADAALEGAAESAVEALVAADVEAARMEALDFRGGTGRWWARTVRRDQKLELLRRLTGELGDGLLDVQVRDLETLDVGQLAPAPDAVTPAQAAAPEGRA